MSRDSTIFLDARPFLRNKCVRSFAVCIILRLCLFGSFHTIYSRFLLLFIIDLLSPLRESVVTDLDELSVKLHLRRVGKIHLPLK